MGELSGTAVAEVAPRHDEDAASCSVETNGSNGRYPSLLTEEPNVKIRTIAVATLFSLSTTLAVAPAQAKHRHHHHHKHGMSMGSSGSSGPSMDGGHADKSRAGGQGVSRKQPGE